MFLQNVQSGKLELVNNPAVNINKCSQYSSKLHVNREEGRLARRRASITDLHTRMKTMPKN